jgi:tetratricopeptide (TPR) repeat protein
MARICVHFGHLLYFSEPDREQCQHYLHRARQLLEGTPHKAELAACYSELSLALFDTEPEEAIRYGRLSLAIAPRVDSNTIMAHQALFNAYKVLEDLEQARHHLELAREMARKIGQVVAEGYAELNLMTLYIRLKQYPEAVQSGQRAWQIWQQVGNAGLVGDVLSGLVVACHLAGESDAAEQYEAEANSLPVREARFFYNQACWWSLGGNQDKSLEILAEVYPSFDEQVRRLALTDVDLAALRERPEFWEIVGDSTAGANGDSGQASGLLSF